jgi:Cytochrome P460
MRRALVVVGVLVAGCGEEEPGLEPWFPASYASSYVEVRNCRASSEHDLHKIHVLAPPASAAIYTARTDPFPVGTVLLKEEYDFTDDTCAEPILEWTVMERLDTGWAFQRVNADRTVESENDTRCIGCHQMCGVPPDGFDGTCAVP